MIYCKMPIMILFYVDAFTDQPFHGNPAAICILEKSLDEKRMQQIASEINLSETAFILAKNDGYSLRWFTPTVEVDLCGHATLASAHILWEQKHLSESESAVFHTKSGVLTCKKISEFITMDFPIELALTCPAPEGLKEALKADFLYVGKNRMDYLIEVKSEEIIRNLEPDLMKLSKIPCRGFIVTARSSSPKYDFVSRVFGPAVGIPEDPVTGSAHCCLGPYWKEKLGKNPLNAYQVSKRGGEIRADVQGNRVLLQGKAVTVMKAEILK
jgi:PhzF family phenazine biosynthesis protein